MPEKSRQAHWHFLYASELHKIKFRFPERWQKKLNRQDERRQIMQQKLNVNFSFETHLIFCKHARWLCGYFRRLRT